MGQFGKYYSKMTYFLLKDVVTEEEQQEAADIQSQLNQCGLSSQFNSSGGSSSTPLQRYRYQQDFQGL